MRESSIDRQASFHNVCFFLRVALKGKEGKGGVRKEKVRYAEGREGKEGYGKDM